MTLKPQGILPYTKSSSEVFDWLDLNNGFFGWNLPGHGESYSGCGSFYTKGCLNVEGHRHKNQKGLNDNFEGLAVLKRIKSTCLRALCPVCYESWAGKEANKIEYRLSQFKTRFKPIHLMISIPQRLWYLNTQKMRKLVYKYAKRSGFIGGSAIFHPFRESSGKRWFFSPHFHLIGFGWIKNTSEVYEESGFVIKNLGLRKSVFATAQYQLSHAGIHKKHHTVTWFGCCSYNKLKVPRRPEEKDCCPICEQKFVKVLYSGEDPLPDEVGVYFRSAEHWIYDPGGGVYG